MIIRIAVCEDKAEDSALLQEIINKEKTLLHLQLHADYFDSGEALLAAAKKGCRYQLLLLDIFMGQTNGVETARAIRDIQPDVCIAFLTSSREYALEAFALDAVHYLTKPVNCEEFRTLLERYLKRTQHPLPEAALEIRSDSKTYRFPLPRVQKIQSSRKGVDVYLAEAERPVHIPISFARLESQLNSSRFLRISRGLVVQMSYISYINGGICRFCDGTEALISRRDKSAIRQKYNDYLFQQCQKGEGDVRN